MNDQWHLNNERQEHKAGHYKWKVLVGGEDK
jgi:hypothetical protein